MNIDTFPGIIVMKLHLKPRRLVTLKLHSEMFTKWKIQLNRRASFMAFNERKARKRSFPMSNRDRGRDVKNRCDRLKFRELNAESSKLFPLPSKVNGE